VHTFSPSPPWLNYERLPARAAAIVSMRSLVRVIHRAEPTALSSRYRLRAADATHLATAVGLGADRFITNNQRDFPVTMTEVRITYPADL
jgi:predicted nucleic acid-binding protein